MRQLLGITFAAFLSLPFTVRADAQSRPASGATDQVQVKEGERITIVGCLLEQNASDSSGEVRGEPGTTATEFFVRTPAIAVPVGTTLTITKPSASGAGTTTSAGKPTDIAMYRITGLNRDELRPHVGHRVELQGHLSGNMSADTPSGAPVATADPIEKRRSIDGILHATTIKMVSASCEASQ